MIGLSNDVKYKDYFDIDENFYPEVNEELIKSGKVKWQGYYPHETFIDLLKKTEAMLSGRDSRSIWVEGAYGTGKSHAALTVKSLLEASDGEIREYFNQYGLDADLAQKLITAKNNKNLITVHRIGSSSIHTDADLIWAIQESIEKELDKRGIENRGEASFKSSIVKWLKDPEQKQMFEVLLKNPKYNWGYGSADEIIDVLENSKDELIVHDLIGKIVKAGKEKNMKIMQVDIEDMTEWIKSLLKENDISILFVWDEFNEYFEHNPSGLTGFQTLLELSLSHNFYFIIVTHMGKAIISDKATQNKITDRFAGGSPISIELPENMAFQLMAKAMRKTEDENLKSDWEKYKRDLNARLGSVRSVLIEDSKKNSGGKKTYFKSEELEDIVPIHPYAALLLKHMAVAFNSNARSMFDFIISNDKENAKGFKWYIEEYGPFNDTDNLLTIDMLWDFFNGKSKRDLNDDVRQILDHYQTVKPNSLTTEQDRVLKTVLLLAAISSRVSGVELLRPNDRNIDLAFLGLEGWAPGKGKTIAHSLKEKGIIYEHPGAKGDNKEYIIAKRDADTGRLEGKKEELRRITKTAMLIDHMGAVSATELDEAVKARFDLASATADNFRQQKAKLENNLASNKFGALITFAKNEAEETALKKLIAEAVSNPNNNLIFIESLTPMGEARFNEYIEHLAYHEIHVKSDKALSQTYGNFAAGDLSSWKEDISQGAFRLYTPDNPNGLRLPGNKALNEKLTEIDRMKYPAGIEFYNVTDVMFKAGSLLQGARSGINEKTEQAFNAKGRATSLELNLKDAWQIPEYWKNPEKSFVTIVRIKNRVDEIVSEKFASPSGRVSITEIFDALEGEPFGFLPNNLTAFVLGFVLKEYAVPDYFWSDGTASDVMSAAKLASAISDAIKQKNNPSAKFKEQYIVAMSEPQRKFLELSSEVFNIPPEKCGSVESARDNIRSAMRKLSFPLWCAEYAAPEMDLKTPVETVSEAIELYCALANNINANKRSESDIADKIGSLYIEKPSLLSDLKKLATSDACNKGMTRYIEEYKDGKLYNLSLEIKDYGSYLDRLKEKFNADAANWVWNKETAEDKISEVILEYSIIAETNKVLSKSTTLEDALTRWISSVRQIKIPYDELRPLASGFSNLAAALHALVRDNYLRDQDKKKFYNAVVSEKDAFINFLRDQYPYFDKANKIFLQNLEDEYKSEFFGIIGGGQYTKTSSEYFAYIENELDNFKKRMLKTKLNELWLNKTGTKSPREWSDKYLTPILCMIDDKDFTEAKECFDTINQKISSDGEIRNAIEYLERACFYDRLSDPEERDKRFMERIAGDYAVMLKSPNEIRSELKDRIPSSVYEWVLNPSVERCVKNMAEKQYKLKGCDEAKSIIETMDSENLKHYLNSLIADNMTVGIEILKNR